MITLWFAREWFHLPFSHISVACTWLVLSSSWLLTASAYPYGCMCSPRLCSGRESFKSSQCSVCRVFKLIMVQARRIFGAKLRCRSNSYGWRCDYGQDINVAKYAGLPKWHIRDSWGRTHSMGWQCQCKRRRHDWPEVYRHRYRQPKQDNRVCRRWCSLERRIPGNGFIGFCSRWWPWLNHWNGWASDRW